MQCLRPIVALMAIALLPLPSFCSPPSGKDKAAQTKALEALNRLTFGPRPGEAEVVERMGVNHWIDRQLHPEKIDDSALQQRLENYAAPFQSPQDLLWTFPPRTLIRQAADGRVTVPTAEPEHAIWVNEMARLERAGKLKQEPQGAPAPPPATPNVGEEADARRNFLRLLSLPPQQRYEALLHVIPGSMPSLVRMLPPARRPSIVSGMTPAQREAITALLNPRVVVVNEAQSVRLLKDIYSERQLQRVMTEFWLNHFNVYAGKNEVEPYYLPQFEQDVIAPRASGKFEDLLDAVAQSPAMLVYLDNRQSIGPGSRLAGRRKHGPDAPLGINENYGRELLELHTVGVNGGYTQDDVVEAAKVLTGWTVRPPQGGGGFRFEAERHEPGDKVVMSSRIKEGGQNEGFELLHLLATRPATARFLCQALAVRFVSDHPKPALVNRMVKTFLASDGDIAAVLKAMVASPDFWAAPVDSYKIKTPLDYVVSAVRATDAEVVQPFSLVTVLQGMGMPLDGTQQPNGYSMTNEAWTNSSGLVHRMNFALTLAAQQIPGVTIPYDRLLSKGGTALLPQEKLLEATILHRAATPQLHAAVLRSLEQTGELTPVAMGTDPLPTRPRSTDPFAPPMQLTPLQNPEAQLATIAGLLLGSPEFQQR